jgi:hypothetical protein
LANNRRFAYARAKNQRELARELTDLLAEELRKGDSDIGPQVTLPAPKIFFAKTSFTPKATPFDATEPFLDRFLSEDA